MLSIKRFRIGSVTGSRSAVLVRRRRPRTNTADQGPVINPIRNPLTNDIFIRRTEVLKDLGHPSQLLSDLLLNILQVTNETDSDMLSQHESISIQTHKRLKI